MIRVDELEDLGRAALVAVWAEVFEEPAPKGISRTFLRQLPAFEVQARRSGGLSKSVDIRLATMMSHLSEPKHLPSNQGGGFCANGMVSRILLM